MDEEQETPAGSHGDSPDPQSGQGRTADPVLREVLIESQQLGFLGPGPVDAHVRHAAGFVTVVGDPAEILDLGSGGGLPGLVLARVLPTTRVVLLDAMERRCRFLAQAIERLDLGDRVSVECGRAEELARRTDLRAQFAAVVTRSFGAPAVTAECAAGFLRSPGGRLLVSEPPDGAARWPEEGLSTLSLRLAERRSGEGWTVQVLELERALDVRYPRRTGVPAKRPLF